MHIRKLNRSSPEIVFLVVRNVDSTTLSVGRGVVWHGSTSTTTYEGIGVRYPKVTTDQLDGIARFAGVIMQQDIASSAYGWMQVYGLIDSVTVTGSTAVNIGQGHTAAYNDTTWMTDMLRPLNCFTPDANATGMFCFISCKNTAISNLGVYFVPNALPGGYLVPMSEVYTSVHATDGTYITGTLTTQGTGFMKAFVRCL